MLHMTSPHNTEGVVTWRVEYSQGRRLGKSKSMDVKYHIDEITCCSVPHFLVNKTGLMLTIFRALG